jgi:hypothetical protein
MIRLGLPVFAGCLLIAACGEGKPGVATPAAPAATATPPGPATYANIIANPAAYVGQSAKFKLGLAAGVTQSNDLSSTGATIGQGWRDPSGKDWELAPSAEMMKPPEGSCIFVVVNDDKTPVIPLQPVAIDKLEPCSIGADSHDMHGTVEAVRDVQLVLNKETLTLKAPVLSHIDYDTKPF